MSDKAINVSFKVIKIATTGFSFNEPEDTKSLEDGQELGVNLDVALNIETDSDIDQRQLLTVIVTSEFFDKKNKVTLFSHKAKTVFAVEGLEEMDDNVEGEDIGYKIPIDLMVMTQSLAFSHARALLATETSNTIYKDFYLPLIDPAIFTKNKVSQK